MKKFKRYKTGEDLLHGVHQEMSKAVPRSKQVRRSGTVPKNIIHGYLKDVETVHDIAYGESGSKHKIELLKKFYYSKYVLKELPKSYVELQKRIAREEGRGDVEVDRERALKILQADQRRSLDEWIDYLNSPDSIYPMWFKNYAFQEMVKIGKFDKEKETFGKRSKSDTEPFVELNREALAKVYDTVSKLVGKEETELSEEDMAALAEGNSFKKIYTHYLVQAMKKTKAKGTEGVWVKYEQGENYQELWKSLQGKNTGWCTAGEETAQQHVQNGDFYVYYTKGETEEYTEPRLAIRMNGKDQIAEVRGVGHGQNVELEMTDILDKKLDEFQDKEAYEKRLHDMKLLTKIEEKQNNGEDLSKEEIRFLYEIDGKIQGFGWDSDPRIKEIKEKRDAIEDLVYALDGREEFSQPVNNMKRLIQIEEKQNRKEELSKDEIKFLYEVGNNALVDINSRTKEIIEKRDIIKDLSFAYDCKEEEILVTGFSYSRRQPKAGQKIVACYGYLKEDDLEKYDTNGLKYVFGTVDLSEATTVKGLENLEIITEDAYFENLTSAKGLESLKRVGANANFSSLLNAEGLNSLTEIGENANFDSLISANGLNNLTEIGKDAFFNKLKNAEGLEKLKQIGKKAYLFDLSSAEGFKSLEKVETIYANSLKNANGLESLKEIKNVAYFPKLVSAKGFGNLTIKNEEDDRAIKTNFSSLKNSDGAEGVKINRGQVKIRQGNEVKEVKLKEPTMLTDLIPRSKGAQLKDAMAKSADLDEKIEEAQGLLGKIKQLISEKIRRDK